MTDDAAQTATDDNTAPVEDSKAADSGEEVSQNQSTEDEIPEWVREKLTKANNEAARYRTKAKEAADTARQEVESEFTDRVTALEQERDERARDLEDTRLELTKVQVALKSDVTGEDALEFAQLLQGETEEELLAHAEKVKKLMTSTANVGAYDRYQGYGRESKAPDPQSDFGAFLLNQLNK